MDKKFFKTKDYVICIKNLSEAIKFCHENSLSLNGDFSVASVYIKVIRQNKGKFKYELGIFFYYFYFKTESTGKKTFNFEYTSIVYATNENKSKDLMSLGNFVKQIIVKQKLTDRKKV